MSKIHFIGIKGVGMAALAVYAKEKGHEITGSDDADSFVTDKILSDAGIQAKTFSTENISRELDLIIYSAAYDKDNVELKEAKKRHLDIKTFSEGLAAFSRDQQVIAVGGIHGKTTTTAMISFILLRANLDPSYIIGSGEVAELSSTGHSGSGEYFVLEADEYKKSIEDTTAKFLDFNPEIEIISSIELDHPDLYPTEESIYTAFYKFACRIPRTGLIVLNYDYPKAKKLRRSLVDRHFATYGFEEGADFQIINFEEKGKTSFSLRSQEGIIGPFDLQVLGRANILNAAAAVIVCLRVGLSDKIIKKHLYDFKGVKRRLELIGQVKDIVVYDDYAHHPKSINMTLETLKNKYDGYKIWCIFQPHTYSRTKKLLDEFRSCFRFADKLIITDIYSSAREKEEIITGEEFAQAVKEKQRNVLYIPQKDKIPAEIAVNLVGKNVVVTMGAGDIYKIGPKIIELIK